MSEISAMDEDEASVAGETPNPPNTLHYSKSEYFGKKLKSWLHHPDNEGNLKLFRNAVEHMEQKFGIELSSFDLTCLEWQYVKSVLEIWQEKAFEKASQDLTTTNHPSEISILVNEFNSISSFHDVETTQLAQSRVRIWCDGGCRYFQLIAKQGQLFKQAPRFAILVPCHFNNFKILCIKEIFFRCWQNFVKDETNGEKYQKCISALISLLVKAFENKELLDIIELFFEDILDELPTGKAIDWRIFCEEKLQKFPAGSNEESSTPDWFQKFKEAVEEIGKEAWTSRFTLMMNEVLKLYLLPRTKVETTDDNGRKIIFVRGKVVFLSKVIDKMEKLKKDDVGLQEIKIVGLKSVHIDCNLDNDIWHGTNLGLDTDKIIVDDEFSWNFSGQHNNEQNAREPRQPGESGGNVHIICNEMVNAKQWTIISDGGDGSSAHKWTKEEFNQAFPSMSLFEGGEGNMKTVAEALEHLSPEDNVLGNLKEKGYIRGPMSDINEVMVSFYKSETKRDSLIFFQGRGVGQGGYGGSVIVEILNRLTSTTLPNLPCIGNQKRLPSATYMPNVYEACGADGKIGKPAGDIGFIHSVKTTKENKEGRYFGFDSDVRLQLKFCDRKSKDVNLYAKVKPVAGGTSKAKYASIIIDQPVPTSDPTILVEATRKKIILRQSLFQHYSEINQHKEISQSLEEIFSSTRQPQPTSLIPKDLATFNEKLERMMYQDQQNRLEIAQAKTLKPAPLNQLKADTSGTSSLRADEQEVATIIQNTPNTTFDSDVHPNQNPAVRNVEEIISIMQQNENMTNNNLKFLLLLKENVIESKTMDLKESTFLKSIKDQGLNLASDENLNCFLRVYSYGVQKKLGFSLRDAQRVAIMALLQKRPNSKKTLVQVSTGEGKSLIVAGVAIALALSQITKSKPLSPVDVITSNNVLAIRDTNTSSDKGGLKDLYDLFGVSVANNCSHLKGERVKAYEAAVVYGELANFQRDYLLKNFYNYNTRGDREFTNVIIDEVDCMLLDRGSNTLYLSHDIPGMEMLESLYVFIWEMLKNWEKSKTSMASVTKSIKSEVYYDLFGVTSMDDLELVHAKLKDLPSEKTALWNHLVNQKVIDDKGRLVITDANKITKEEINYVPNATQLQVNNLNAKLVFYFRKIANRQRRFRLPSHLLDFVDRNLDTWLNSAFQALDLRRDEHYVIDQDRTDTNLDLNPQVIIIDPDTGTDQTLSQWDGALHQFVQLKEGCKLTLQSLKAVFISNATYILEYNKMMGVSGTLGSKKEQEFLSDKYGCDFFEVPTAFSKKFTLKPTKVLRSGAEWLEEIIKETRDVLNISEGIQDQPQRDVSNVDVKSRSIIIFCRTIREVNQVYRRLKRHRLTRLIHRYTRDYEKFAFESSELGIGHVIVATNLAGRGTDIKISNDLKANGGLHICLTYLPENERIKEQAMGRAGRKGEQGSGILILCDTESQEKDEKLGDEQLFNNMEKERDEQELQRLSRLDEDFKDNDIQKKLFLDFIKTFSMQNIKNELEKCKEMRKTEKGDDVEYQDYQVLVQAIRDSALDKWALWLDTKEFDRSNVEFPDKLHGFENFDNIINWITPARAIAVANDLANSCKKPNLSKAEQILKQLVSSEYSLCYPAAHYYQIFISLKQNKFENAKDEFLRKLRATETIITQQIDMQQSFNSTINQIKQQDKPDEIPFFRDSDAYNEQKKNEVRIWTCLRESIVSLLDNHCSIASLREASKVPDEQPGPQDKTSTEEMPRDEKIRREKVGKYYKSLVEAKCIACELNDPNTIPSQSIFPDGSLRNRSAIIQQIEDDYDCIGASLEKTLVSVFDKALSEQEIEKELEKKVFIPSSRKAFWKKLVDAGALKIPKNGIEMECVIISDRQYEHIPELDREEAIMLNFGYDTYDQALKCLTILYHPIYENKQQLDDSKKLMFPKKYVKRITNYELEKQNFEFNKIALLDLKKLKNMELREFGRLLYDDFFRINIVPAEREGIWKELKKQEIIDDQGFLVPNCDLTKGFNYPQCPIYSDAVMHLIEQKFVAEIVRRQWLKIKARQTMSKEDPDYLKAINFLPLKPHRDMLGDLMAAHVVSGARLMYDTKRKLAEEISKIKDADEREQKFLLEFFEDRLPLYTMTAAPKFSLEPLERIIGAFPSAVNVFSELLVFRLMGLNSVIGIEEQKWSLKRKSLGLLFSSFIIAGGMASISAGVLLRIFCPELPSRLYRNVLLRGGWSDIAYAIATVLSHKDFTWNEYWRQRIRSASGKVGPIEAIHSLRKLSANANKHSDQRVESNDAQIRIAGGKIANFPRTVENDDICNV
ncbi:uncharacterized protein LOC130685885 [Daphnia carinata]|uniref:uncharacterized protein LOC130685885 n=1 Tax=Daphnia carinata TaxID=120202 RepID=UPI00257FDCE3|nr:uncharacterized protein LOC130685885 [Daphnia carinata]